MFRTDYDACNSFVLSVGIYRMLSITGLTRLPLLLLIPCFLTSCSTTELPIATTELAANQAGTSLDAGCLGQPLGDCLGKIRPYATAIAYQVALESIERNKQTDINGNKVFKDNLISIQIQKEDPLKSERLLLSIKYSEKNVITNVTLYLDAGVSYAETDDDYIKLGLYKGATLAIGNQCDTTYNSHTFHKFFHNQLKNKLGAIRNKADVSDLSAQHYISQHSEWISLCGVKMQYEQFFSRDTNEITIDNPKGLSAFFTLEFKK